MHRAGAPVAGAPANVLLGESPSAQDKARQVYCDTVVSYL